MKNMSDEELVRLALTQAKLIPYWMEDDTRNEDELLSRLERGRKAIEFVENVKAIVNTTRNGTVLQSGAIKTIILLIQEYEGTDEN